MKIILRTFMTFLISVSAGACKAEDQKHKPLLSLPFLAGDLNGNGKIDLIPLEESNVYFDVDGDGLAERTEWISPEDGFVVVIGMEDVHQQAVTQSRQERLVSIMASGLDKVKRHIRDKDNIYDKNDFFQPIAPPSLRKPIPPIQELSFSILSDKDSNGLPEGKRKEQIPCTFLSFDMTNNKVPKLNCEEGTYNITPILFEHEDSNVLWEAVCDSLVFGGAGFRLGGNIKSQLLCLKQGYEPQGMWSRNVWETYKKGKR